MPLQGSTPPQPVKRYELTAEGKKYLSGDSRPFGADQRLLLWAEERRFNRQVDGAGDGTGAYSQTEVTYTYKIVDPASLGRAPGSSAGILGHTDNR